MSLFGKKEAQKYRETVPSEPSSSGRFEELSSKLIRILGSDECLKTYEGIKIDDPDGRRSPYPSFVPANHYQFAR